MLEYAYFSPTTIFRKGISFMPALILICLLWFAGCSGADRDTRQTGSSAAQQRGPDSITPPPPPGPPAIKPNLTRIGAEIISIQLIDDTDYSIEVLLNTAIPVGNSETVAEPEQKLMLRPDFARDAEGKILPNDARNKRLLEPRALKSGDPVFGKISLRQNGTWYLIDTSLD